MNTTQTAMFEERRIVAFMHGGRHPVHVFFRERWALLVAWVVIVVLCVVLATFETLSMPTVFFLMYLIAMLLMLGSSAQVLEYTGMLQTSSSFMTET